MRSAGIKPSEPDWPLSSTGLSSLSGCAQVVSPQVLAPFSLGVAFRLSVMLGHDLEPKIFWGHEKSARGEAEPSPAPPHLDPDGWLVRISRTQRTETTGAQTARGARRAPSSRSAEANTPGRKRCGSLTRAF